MKLVDNDDKISLVIRTDFCPFPVPTLASVGERTSLSHTHLFVLPFPVVNSVNMVTGHLAQ